MEYFKQINQNLRYLDVSNIDATKLRDYIVLEKIKRVNSGFKFSLDDLILVRCMYEESFPRSGYYYPYSELNCYMEEKNPFGDYILNMINSKVSNLLSSNLDGFSNDQINIKHAAYRDTKHFTINGISSDIDDCIYNSTFTDRPIVIIESFKEKISDNRLVNINPVDTFFDLHDSRMKVSDNAVILINEEVYNNMIKDDVINEYLSKMNVVIFKGSITVSTDVVLLSLGIMPQHEKNQSILVMESTEDLSLSDQAYLVMFMNYIEEISMKYLGISYLHLSSRINFLRKKDFGQYFPGILHCDTKYYTMEDEKTREYLCRAYADYIYKVIRKIEPKYMLYYEEMMESIYEVVNKRYPFYELNFQDLYNKFGQIILSLLKISGYDKFYSLTQEFNEIQLRRVNKMMIG